MSLRELPEFLKHGDPDLPVGRPFYPGMQIGRGFPEARPVVETGGDDPQSARDWAVWEWVRLLSRTTAPNRANGDTAFRVPVRHAKVQCMGLSKVSP